MVDCVENCEIEISLGKLKGIKRHTLYEDDYFSFERIPFAKPPVGDLRFKAPQPAENWDGVLDCTHYASKPVQKAMLTGVVEGSEDCLYLNVYAKHLKTDKPLPVMVYIYGGAFCMGEATRELYSPDYFMAKDIVLVTLNYRVDSLGFLSFKDPSLEIPGNAGLKDQVLALKWVKQHIKHFNGDFNNITVFGESAGGCSTHFMMCTEQARGLFHKAIPMSGCLHNYWAVTPAADFAYRLAKLHGYEGENIDKQVLAHLSTLEASALVNHALLSPEDRKHGIIFAFGPTIEPYIGDDCVIPKSPLEMVRTSWAKDLPMMLGGTSFEGLFMHPALKANPKGIEFLRQDKFQIVPFDVQQRHEEKEIVEFGERLKKIHFDDAEPSQELITNCMDYYSYKIFWHGFHRTLNSRLTFSTAPTYFYRFDFDSADFNFYRKKFCNDDVKTGVAHADDLCYLFRNSQSWKLEESSRELKTIKRMIGVWVAFATTSDPNCQEIAPIAWEPASKQHPQQVLNISDKVEIIDLPEHKKLVIWDSLYSPEELY